jgi:hypothetical protein
VVGLAVHLGSALNEEELGAPKAATRQRLVDGQGEFDLGLGVAAAGGPLEITASRAAHLWDAGRHGTATAHRDMTRLQLEPWYSISAKLRKLRGTCQLLPCSN